MFDLDRIDGISVGVLGDMALDIYWYADMKKSELSRETPHYPLPVVRETVSPGAGGNVVANIAALKPGKLFVCGVCGNDWRGTLLRERLSSLGADTTGLIEEAGRFTQAYCKPMRMGISDVVYEDPRIDFSAAEPISRETEEAVLRWLDDTDGKLDALCVCDQFHNGTVTEAIRARLSGMKTTVLVDSRYRIGDYRIRGILKPNEDECRAALERVGIPVPADEGDMAAALSSYTGADVLLTLGGRGSLFVTKEKRFATPAKRVEGAIDICGAGDTSLSAFACCYAAGAKPEEAAAFAALASSVTIKKLGTTGTASREELCAAVRN